MDVCETKGGKTGAGLGARERDHVAGSRCQSRFFFFISRSDNSEEMFSSGGSAARRGAVWARAAGRGGQ